MFGFSGAIKFYYCPTPISMRKSFDGLAGAVEEYIQQEPESGHAFVFFGRSRKMVKILQWQGDGFTIWMKRLESGAFHHFLKTGTITGTADLFSILLIFSLQNAGL